MIKSFHYVLIIRMVPILICCCSYTTFVIKSNGIKGICLGMSLVIVVGLVYLAVKVVEMEVYVSCIGLESAVVLGPTPETNVKSVNWDLIINLFHAIFNMS